VLAVAIAGAAPPSGTWKLSVANTRFESGSSPFKRFSLTFIPAEDGAYRVRINAQTSNGARINAIYLLKEDGKDYPVTNAPFDSISVTNGKSNVALIPAKRRSNNSGALLRRDGMGKLA